jgi:hypothetical protein
MIVLGLFLAPAFGLRLLHGLDTDVFVWALVGVSVLAFLTLFRPIGVLGLNTKGRPLALLMGTIIAVIVLLGDYVEEREARLTELKVSDPTGYLDKLKTWDRSRWLSEMEEIDPRQHAVEMANIAAQEAEEEKRRVQEAHVRALQEAEAAKARALEAVKREAREREKICSRSSSGDAYSQAKLYVKALLFQPHTASFAWEPQVTVYMECIFVVKSYVDAKNAFGAKIRTHFSVRLRRNEQRPNEWKLEDIATY